MNNAKFSFKALRWKNFLSYGNYWTDLSLDQGEIVVISGKNGMGKSTFMDAFYFVLTGKPYRATNIGGLVNSISAKKCEVELEFTSGNDEYIVKRGIKPNNFTMYKNGELIPEDGKRVSFYQQKLEELTGLTPSIIKNTLLINSTLKSFFNLSKGDKRAFVDELFPNLTVFGKMLKMEKSMYDELDEKYQNNKHESELVERSIQHQKEQLKQYEDVVAEIKSQKSDDKKRLEELLEALTKENEILSKSIEEAETKFVKISTKAGTMATLIDFTREVDRNAESAKLKYDRLLAKTIKDRCDTCNQTLPLDTIKTLEDKRQKDLDDLKYLFTEKPIEDKTAKLQCTADEIDGLVDKLEKACAEKVKLVEEIKGYIRDNEKKIYSNTSRQRELEAEIKSFNVELPDKPEINIEENKSKIIELTKEIKKQEIYLLHLKAVNKVLLNGELKAYIVSSYIPIINESFNKYLEMFNMDVKIKFDSEFEWEILTRKYKTYQYENFSTGEKMRLNLALMFTFVQLAKIITFGKSQLIYNILCIDEFLDNGMDSDGIEDCLSLLDNKNKDEKVTIFLISHKFDASGTDFKVINVEKESGFSKMKF